MKNVNDSNTERGTEDADSSVRSQVSCLDYRVVIEVTNDGTFLAVCPALLGCKAPGKTYEDALNNIKDAISRHLTDLSQSRNFAQKI